MNKNSLLASLDRIAQLPLSEVHQNYADFVNPALLARMQSVDYCPTFERGEGATLWDVSGKCYLDCHSGYGALSLGHNHPLTVAALHWALDHKIVNLAQASVSRWIGLLGKELAAIIDHKLRHTFFSNSGAEAVEAALKIARKASGKTRIACTKNGFHGKSYGALSVTGQEKYQTPFAPLVPDVTCIEFGDLAALSQILRSRDVAAFIVEPIQGEGGVIVPPDSYLQEAARICKETGTLLILDEIQTGFGRTGTMFRYQALGIEPDILCLAKPLGGGLVAIGATMTTDVVWHTAFGEKADSALHTSTFGGGSLACIVGIAAIKAMQAERVAEQAAEIGPWLKAELIALQKTYPALIQEVRGEGLMLGIEFKKQKGTVGTAMFAAVTKVVEKVEEEKAIAALVARELLRRGVVTAFTLNRENVIRIAPPLIVTKGELQLLLSALEGVLSEFDSLWKLNGGLKGAIRAVMPKKRLP